MQAQLTSLTNAQRRAIPALLSSNTLIEAARQARVGERTLRRWVTENPDFQREFNRARREVVNHSVTRLQRLTTKAADCLEHMLDDQTTPASARVSVVKTVFDYAFKGIEVEDFMVRLAVIDGDGKDVDTETAW